MFVGLRKICNNFTFVLLKLLQAFSNIRELIRKITTTKPIHIN